MIIGTEERDGAITLHCYIPPYSQCRAWLQVDEMVDCETDDKMVDCETDIMMRW